jgi:hypothetical protein
MLSLFASQAIVFLAFAAAASAQTFAVLYNFGSQSNDPSGPAYTGVIAQGRDGNLYTTAPSGAARLAYSGHEGPGRVAGPS